ncbi:heme o synthase [Halomonas sp. McH1-25]|uniref:heme o synthase n=3 Tax=unclassified Halomonas TaxID=2609666 RepID=UPI001EF53AB6|nr:heme o synthase [Halomonas sp. McH1-25]MCG7600522.1 heme o synthase [Halomonas sp. McH1-25]
MIKLYLNLTKPGIIFGNLISVTGGYFLAARGEFDLPLFLATLAGVALVIASGCVFNNVIDRDIDVKMERTRNRALARGLVSPHVALAYATVLGLAGFALLYWGANPLAALFAGLGFFVYVVLYSLYLKRNSVYGTLVGSLSGATPPVIGYCAASGQFDMGGAILLLIFSLWQMPHSYAIAIFRFNDYRAASIPVLPVKKGIAAAKRSIVLYIVAFMAAALALSVLGYAGYGYFAVAATMSLYWLYLASLGYRKNDDCAWAKKQFAFSIVMITALSVMMAVDFRAAPAAMLADAQPQIDNFLRASLSL